MQRLSESHLRERLLAILAADAVAYSRLMGVDERATVVALDEARAVFRARIEASQARVVDMAGDSVLAVFETATAAVLCAFAIQRDLEAAPRGREERSRLRFRLGVHLGDVIEKADGSVYGDGVNVAARLQSLAAPGGVVVSAAVRGAIGSRMAVRSEDLGLQAVKNIAEPVHAFRLFETAVPDAAKPEAGTAATQPIRFCSARDGAQLAWTSQGSGPPLVLVGRWMTHLEFEMEPGSWSRRIFDALSAEHTLIRYDARANGLSDWNVDDISFEAWVSDLESVLDAAGVERCALLGVSQSCAVSIAFAVRHPQRVSHLVCYGGFAKGFNRRSPTQDQKDAQAAMTTLMRIGWGQDNPAFRQLFTTQFIPDSSRAQQDWFNELQRRAASPANAVRYADTVADIDVGDLLPRVTVPTLVMHSRRDARIAFELGRRMAAGIAGARFLPIDSLNHVPLEHEPAFGQFVDETLAFLRG
jgi:class 3 adenylate cyclase/pimeloyl-ACP methyl ester carboxylesterase